MKFNKAQMIYLRLGVDPMRLLQFSMGKQFSYTKRGPGRKHKQGKAEA